ncbi:urea amidolyase family protein [Microbacterium sp.]|uniref:5-oxoprolinase subunit B/C family protein n=1 Tax=Microbacterium sp. TaxID=51671 RepID=UPI002637DB33|nr:urea amidolyase family protein [Microbacterium sp.]
MRILTASDHALLVEAADLDEAMRLNLAWDDVPGIVERIPGARTVLVRFDPLRVTAAELASVLEATQTDAERIAPTRQVTVPVRYDGEDLAATASLLGVSTEELVNRHLAADWHVAFSGFAPGFGYLVSGDALFDVPRRSSPRTRVPAGSVGLAGAFTGVYPRESPGGWQLIGRSDAVMWDIDRNPPALLVSGALVKFERAEGEGLRLASFAQPVSTAAAVRPSLNDPQQPSGALTEGSPRGRESESQSRGSLSERSEPKRVERAEGESKLTPAAEEGESKPSPTIEVIRHSLQLLIQDRGRPGHAALGVTASGAADRTAMRDANHAVGNARGAAVLESIGGPTLRFHGNGVAAVTGALGDITLTDAAGFSRSIRLGTPFATADGDELTLGHPTHGLRYIIGVRGGIDMPPALGSHSTDTLAGLGPAALAAGDIVAVGDAAERAVAPDAQPRALPASGDLVELEITLGPRDDWFTASARHNLTTQEWVVTPRSDRVGIRLQGDVPLERATAGELPSEGAVTGAIQVPLDGQPVLFGPDHPLTGGYPIIGALTDGFIDLAGQLPPGARVRFRVR